MAGKPLATAGVVIWVLLMAAGAAWPQAAPPPSSPGVQAPAQPARAGGDHGAAERARALPRSAGA